MQDKSWSLFSVRGDFHNLWQFWVEVWHDIWWAHSFEISLKTIEHAKDAIYAMSKFLINEEPRNFARSCRPIWTKASCPQMKYEIIETQNSKMFSQNCAFWWRKYSTICMYCLDSEHMPSFEWRHNECDGVSNHQPHDCLLNLLFKCRSKKTSKLRVTGLCVRNGIHRWPMNSPHKGPVTRKMFPFDDVIMVPVFNGRVTAAHDGCRGIAYVTLEIYLFDKFSTSET